MHIRKTKLGLLISRILFPVPEKMALNSFLTFFKEENPAILGFSKQQEE